MKKTKKKTAVCKSLFILLISVNFFDFSLTRRFDRFQILPRFFGNRCVFAVFQGL